MGGGGSSRNCSRYKINHIPSIPGHFWYIFGPPANHPPFMDTRGNSGTLPMSAYTFRPRNNINSFRKKTFTKRLGGAMAPLAPPGYATVMLSSICLRSLSSPTNLGACIHPLQVNAQAPLLISAQDLVQPELSNCIQLLQLAHTKCLLGGGLFFGGILPSTDSIDIDYH